MRRQKRGEPKSDLAKSMVMHVEYSTHPAGGLFRIQPSRRQAEAAKNHAILLPDDLPITRLRGHISGKRFRVGTIRWTAYDGLVEYLADVKNGRYRHESYAEAVSRAISMTGFGEEVIEKAVERFRTDSFVLRKPSHALDLPDVIIGSHGRAMPDDEFSSRKAALMGARDANKIRLRKKRIGDWALVLEVGETIEQPSPIESVYSGKRGVETVTTYRPVRVVTPTSQELAALGCTDKEGEPPPRPRSRRKAAPIGSR